VSALLRNRFVRPFVLLTLSFALVAGAGACSSGKKTAPEPRVEETTTTIAANQTEIATAKNATLTVYSELPKSATTTSSLAGGNPTTTAPAGIPTNTMAAIPRNGLNSAGVKKTTDGHEFTNPTYFKNPLVVDVIEHQGEWLKVLITARPNHTQGWVKASDVTLTTTDFRMELDLSTFHLKVFKGNELFTETDVAIGKDSTKTPTGRFFITEKIKQPNDTGVFGSWLLAINGYSEMLDTFDNGLPQVAFHGTNQPELIGTKASNGCIRMPNAIVTMLADAIPAGTPVDIFSTTPVSWTGSGVSAKP